MTNLRARAEELADVSLYTVDVDRDETTDDNTPVWLVTIRELPGCMAQGSTLPEALHNLRDAMIDYIQSLLEDGLPVPAVSRTGSTSAPEGVREWTYPPPSREPRDRSHVGAVSWVA